jgi:hypothetical protein
MPFAAAYYPQAQTSHSENFKYEKRRVVKLLYRKWAYQNSLDRFNSFTVFQN